MSLKGHQSLSCGKGRKALLRAREPRALEPAFPGLSHLFGGAGPEVFRGRLHCGSLEEEPLRSDFWGSSPPASPLPPHPQWGHHTQAPHPHPPPRGTQLPRGSSSGSPSSTFKTQIHCGQCPKPQVPALKRPPSTRLPCSGQPPRAPSSRLPGKARQPGCGGPMQPLAVSLLDNSRRRGVAAGKGAEPQCEPVATMARFLTPLLPYKWPSALPPFFSLLENPTVLFAAKPTQPLPLPQLPWPVSLSLSLKRELLHSSWEQEGSTRAICVDSFIDGRSPTFTACWTSDQWVGRKPPCQQKRGMSVCQESPPGRIISWLAQSTRRWFWGST